MNGDGASLLLSRAADVIEKKGWCQKVYALDALGEETHPFDPLAERFCALGALDYALKTVPNPHLSALQARNRLRQIVGNAIPTFNDAPQRRKEEVVAALRSASEL